MQTLSQQTETESKKEMAETKTTAEQSERLIELESGEQKLDDIENLKPQKRTCKNPSPGTIVRISLLVVLLTGITVFLGFLIGSNDVQKSMISALDWISDLPKWSSTLLVSTMYCVALLLFCPGTPFNLAAGFLFGLWIGTGVALLGCVLGALIAFLLGRTIFRDWVKNRMEKRPKFKAVDWAIQKNGLYIVFLTRLSPLFPFPLLNYAFGITKVQVWKYFLGTLVGVTPATFGYTYLGTLMRSLADIWTVTDVSSDDSGSKKTNHIIYLAVGSLVTVLSIIIISFITKRAISKATREYELMHPEENVSKNTELTEVKLSSSPSENNNETSEGDPPRESAEVPPVVELQPL